MPTPTKMGGASSRGFGQFGGIRDPFFSSVTLLLPCSGTNGSTTIPNLGSAATSVTCVGNAALSTSAFKFAPSSLALDGVGDYIDVGAATGYAFPGDFTVEMWINTSTITSDGGFFRRILMLDGPTGNAAGNMQFAVTPVTGFWAVFTDAGVDLNLTGTTNIGTGAWVFLALSRTGTALRGYVNGVLDVSATYSTSLTANAGSPRPRFGSYNGTIGNYLGNEQAMRWTKGVGRYPVTCPVPTAPFPTS